LHTNTFDYIHTFEKKKKVARLEDGKNGAIIEVRHLERAVAPTSSVGLNKLFPMGLLKLLNMSSNNNTSSSTGNGGGGGGGVSRSSAVVSKQDSKNVSNAFSLHNSHHQQQEDGEKNEEEEDGENENAREKLPKNPTNVSSGGDGDDNAVIKKKEAFELSPEIEGAQAILTDKFKVIIIILHIFKNVQCNFLYTNFTHPHIIYIYIFYVFRKQVCTRTTAHSMI
jgi:hypothetical protein